MKSTILKAVFLGFLVSEAALANFTIRVDGTPSVFGYTGSAPQIT